MKLISWNVNGIRSCAEKGFLEWFVHENADVVCIQETKAWPDQLPTTLTAPTGYTTFWATAEKKGYSGVATYTRQPPQSTTTGLGVADHDGHGRTLVHDFGDFVLFNCYFPNAQDDLNRLPLKLAYDSEILKQCEKYRREGRSIIVCGDFNVAHQPIDIKNAKANEGCSGYTKEERAWMTEFLGLGYVDAFRHLHPNAPDHYTWWSAAALLAA
jgi:exodeoxyribonuclease-3